MRLESYGQFSSGKEGTHRLYGAAQLIGVMGIVIYDGASARFFHPEFEATFGSHERSHRAPGSLIVKFSGCPDGSQRRNGVGDVYFDRDAELDVADNAVRSNEIKGYASVGPAYVRSMEITFVARISIDLD